MKKQSIKELKENFRDLYWSFHQRTCKLSDDEVKKRLEKIAKALDKEGINII